MRTYALAIAASAFFAFPTSTFSQNIEIGPGGVHTEAAAGTGMGLGSRIVRNCGVPADTRMS